ncbi:MAG: hypothetical protein FWD51_03175 [Betaproteobacteria bacterium]|nr:hypothetical protein [Betaproteobacteria bacterium]
MMPRPLTQYLRVAAILAVSGLLSACCSIHPHEKALARGDEVWCSPDLKDGEMGCFNAPKGVPICPIELNVVQCYFYDYDGLGVLTQEQRKVLRQALQDALTLPLEELEKKRYPGDKLFPNSTVVEIIGRNFGANSVIRGWGYVGYHTDGFLPALKSPKSTPSLKKALEEVEEAIRCVEAGECDDTIY